MEIIIGMIKFLVFATIGAAAHAILHPNVNLKNKHYSFWYSNDNESTNLGDYKFFVGSTEAENLEEAEKIVRDKALDGGFVSHTTMPIKAQIHVQRSGGFLEIIEEVICPARKSI